MSERYSSRLTRLPLLAQDNWHIWKLRLKVVVAGMGLRDAFSFPLVETEEEERDEEQDEPASVVISVLDGRYTHDCLRQDPGTFRVWLTTLDAKAAQKREEAYALMIGAVHDNCIHLISGIPSDLCGRFLLCGSPLKAQRRLERLSFGASSMPLPWTAALETSTNSVQR